MNNPKHTKKALLLSVLSLLVCVSMLVGTTFAWFTDSVSTGKNVIASGNLDVQLQYKLNLNDQWQEVTSDTELFDDEALWEPGYTQVVYLQVKNAGSLELKYQIGMNVIAEQTGLTKDGKTIRLSDYIMFGTVEATAEADLPATREAAKAAATNAKTIYAQYDHPYYDNGELAPGESDLVTLVAFMPETVGNEANHNGVNKPSIQLGLNLTAAQKMAEKDSFNNEYDKDATLPQSGFGTVAAPETGVSAVEIVVRNQSTNAKLATVTVPAAAVDAAAEDIDVKVEKTELDENFTVEADQEATAYEVTVTGLAENNTTPVKVELRVGTGLSGVKVYHYDTEITDAVYNEQTGYVTFYTTSFSPFTVVYDAEYTPVVPTDPELPQASLVEMPEYAGVEIEWAGFGGLYPSNLEQQMEIVYNFSTTQTTAEMQASKYRTWYCDFYVSCDRDVPANAIFLGGNYGGYGWVGFENVDQAVEANVKVPLLGSVGDPWTYESIHAMVGSFLCGVSRTYGTDMSVLEGATFTVELRLTNPENAEEYYNVAVVNYTFPAAN